MSFKAVCLSFAAGALLLASQSSVQAQEPRVAVWNPEKGTNESRFSLNLKSADQAAAWLKESGCQVERLTAEQIADANAFNADKFDALMLQGDGFPKADLPAIKSFAAKGGVLVSLGAKIPFLIAMEKEKDGFWTMAPKTPAFAWQSVEVLGLYGMRYVYNETMQDKGVEHNPTSLLEKYLPAARPIKGNVRGWWIIPTETGGAKGLVYPLVRSKRADGVDTTPQIFIAKSGSKHAIFCLNEWYADGSKPALWPCSKELVLAFAKIAKDLKSGSLDLSKEAAVEIGENTPPPQPMKARVASGSVEPEGARPLARWGLFDGTGVEFGAPLAKGVSKSLPLGASAKDFPSSLEAGASVKLAIPKLPDDAPCYLRVRFCFVQSNAGLKAKMGERELLDELFISMDASGQGNFSNYSGEQPIDANRILFIPPEAKAASEIEISNPGRSPVYFDAVQIETRSKPSPERWIGLYTGFSASFPDQKTALKPGVGDKWSRMRSTIRGQFIGAPGSEDRWAKVDFLVKRYLEICPRLDLLFEGTAEWNAVSADRYAAAKKAGRPHTCVPDTDKFMEVVDHFVKAYGDRIDNYEVWNETNIQQFWRGSYDEYADFFIAISKRIKELSPKATVIMAGMAGYREEFVSVMHEKGAYKFADLCGFHPYAGKSSGWDLPYGMIQSDLYSRGEDIEIYCNESGFVFKAGEWFTPPPAYSEKIQEEQLNVATGRLLASGLAKLNVFMAGGDSQHFGLIDENGRPRLAYAVMEDYFELGKPGSRRLDVQMAPSDPVPLQGVYVAGASCDADGSASIVVNPSQSSSLGRKVRLCAPLAGNAASWTASARSEGAEVPLKAEFKASPAGPFCELELAASGRTLIKIAPSK